ncbi:hypothetical protein KVV02_000551 [Mortierella alpina]|uniref:Uncharacterized protein n=1 Tax=Mortierella alpina TaxID=64518 RepID=A0A9P8A333_MORAP|nr:hypothetical protein KVV02_000551 [Mortierella alpina]
MALAMGNRKGRVDVLSFYGVIKNAFSHPTPDKAHTILEQHLLRFDEKSNLVLYVDAIDNNGKPRKSQFVNVKSSLGSTFHWPYEDRQSFVAYMVQAGWTVRTCETEAGVAIAVDCQPSDVVFSADSDMLGYVSVATLWRPVNKYQVLDNYSIIKSLDKTDPKSMVDACLANIKVSTKNQTGETFSIALRVFVHMTLIDPQVLTPGVSFIDLRKRFQDVCTKYEHIKKNRVTEESPDQSAPEMHSQQLTRITERSQQLGSTIQDPSSQQDLGRHPPLPRTRTPRLNRPRYLFKRIDRKKLKRRPPPPKMKQYVLKAYKESERKPEKPKAKPKPKPALKSLSDSTASTDKLAVKRLMAYQHPTATFHVGTLSANVERGLRNQSGLQTEVMSVLQSAISEAARIKRQAQRLIGKYLEHLSRKGVESLEAEDRRFLDLLCPRVSMADVKDDSNDAIEDDEDGDRAVAAVDGDKYKEEENDNDDSDLGASRGGSNGQPNSCEEQNEQVEGRLLRFYNGSNSRVKKRTWDLKRAKQVEYQAIAASLLGAVGGDIGRHQDPDNPVLIGVGLSQFQSTGRLMSLHSSFLAHFVPLTRSLGYAVEGLNEFYTSKNCPDCKNFVA